MKRNNLRLNVFFLLSVTVPEGLQTFVSGRVEIKGVVPRPTDGGSITVTTSERPTKKL